MPFPSQKVESGRSASFAAQFLKMRLVVAFLGESKQHGWWDCGFLDAVGIRFLETTFPRSAAQAALHSTTEAARLVHDRAVGKVGVFHLFRLPLPLEDRLEAVCREADWNVLRQIIASKESALDCLNQLANAVVKAPEGPVQVGTVRKIFTTTAVQEVAAHYRSAFASGIQCFPYFAQA